MRYINLTKGKVAIIDDQDYELVSQYKWYYGKNSADHMDYKSGQFMKMHRLIMNCPKGLEVDHINGNGLDNRRENLRICTHGQNTLNRGMQKRNSAGYKGVTIDKRRTRRPYRASIRVAKKYISLGSYQTAIEAAIAYNEAAIEYHGEFARINDL